MSSFRGIGKSREQMHDIINAVDAKIQENNLILTDEKGQKITLTLTEEALSQLPSELSSPEYERVNPSKKSKTDEYDTDLYKKSNNNTGSKRKTENLLGKRRSDEMNTVSEDKTNNFLTEQIIDDNGKYKKLRSDKINTGLLGKRKNDEMNRDSEDETNNSNKRKNVELGGSIRSKSKKHKLVKRCKTHRRHSH